MVLALLAAAGALLGAPGKTALVVAYYPSGLAGPGQTWRLSCAPAHGTHPTPGRACLELRLRQAMAELRPPAAPCRFMIGARTPYARVEGRVRGVAVKRLVRPGCDDAAWHDLHFLLTGS
jgi:hypothetical protein